MKNKIFIYTFLLLTSCQVVDQPFDSHKNSEKNIPFVNPPQTDPVFPGKMDSLKLFLRTNIELEKFKIDNGRAAYIFKIDTTGKPKFSELKCTGCEFPNQNELSKYLNQITKKMPLWIPATQRGEKVYVHMWIPLIKEYFNSHN